MQAAPPGALLEMHAAGHKRRRSIDNEHGEAAPGDQLPVASAATSSTDGALSSAEDNAHGLNLVLPEHGGASAPGTIMSLNAARSNNDTVPTDAGVAEGSSPPPVARMLDVCEVGHGIGRGALM